MQIREMNLLDLEKISPILESEFDDFWNENVFKQELENTNSKYVVYTENDEILGFAGIWICIDEAHITNIVVKKSHRNNKIGSKLLEELVNLAKSLSLNSITLEVRSDNLAAIKIYEKYNFENLGIRKKYYENTYDAIIMTKKLK